MSRLVYLSHPFELFILARYVPVLFFFNGEKEKKKGFLKIGADRYLLTR